MTEFEIAALAELEAIRIASQSALLGLEVLASIGHTGLALFFMCVGYALVRDLFAGIGFLPQARRPTVKGL